MSDDPQLNPRQLLELLLAQKYDLLSDKLIQLWQYFERVTYLALDGNTQYFIDALVKNFLYIFTQPDYVLSDRHVAQFIQLNPTISNVVALSCFKTTDGHLRLLKVQPKNFAKLLTLYSARNEVKLAYDVLFEASADHACLWYSVFFETYPATVVDKAALQNLQGHLSYDHPALNKFYRPALLYQAAMEIDGQNDRRLKEKINQSLGQGHQSLSINHQPQAHKIAVISCFWYPGHPTYEQFHPFIDALAPRYDLTLITVGPVRSDLDTHPFHRVLNLKLMDGQLELNPLLPNDFMVVYFPDGAARSEYIALANLRLAPIQIMGLGYPSSSWGSHIDYVISGAKVELPKNAQAHYGERLILLPNYGVITAPIATPPGLNRTLTPPEQGFQGVTPVIINCPWSKGQINYPWLLLLTKIIKQTTTPIKFRFLLPQEGTTPGQNYYLPLVQTIEDLLGQAQVEIIPHDYEPTYFNLMATGDLTLDSYPLSSISAMVTALTLGQPVVALQGKKWHNRLLGQMLVDLGLGELVTVKPSVYVNTVKKLIDDVPYRHHIRDRLQGADLRAILANDKDITGFVKVIGYLIKHHDQLRHQSSSQPIVVKG